MISITSNIKGYHIFRVKPHPKVEMVVHKEDNNKYDAFAMIVKMPNLCDINPLLHGEIVSKRKGATSEQTVKDVSEKIFGRVPANMGKLFRDLHNLWSIEVFW